MKKILLFLFLFSFSFYTYSQEAEEKDPSQEELLNLGQNELKLNPLYLLLGFPELSYERILNQESAIGIAVAFSTEEVFGIDLMAIPYYRVYFGTKPASGFFVEGNAAIFIADYDEEIYYDNYSSTKTSENKLGGGLGLAVGAKFLTTNGWVFEFFGGAGRNFLTPEETGGVYPRLGLTVGRRF